MMLRDVTNSLDPGPRRVDTLAVILGDQLDHQSMALASIRKEVDAVLMMEVDEEAVLGPSHRQRTALFFSAMRHFASELQDNGYLVRYTTIDHPQNTHTLMGEVARAVSDLKPRRITIVQPGDWRVLNSVRQWESCTGIPVQVLEDTHFTCTLHEFRIWAEGRKVLTMEYFYRERRKALKILLESDGQPVGGSWNYDHDNRHSFGRNGPNAPTPLRFKPDPMTRKVIDLVNERYPQAPGRLDTFGWPVTRNQALELLDDFIAYRLSGFGPFEDAMWTGQPWLFHSQLSVPLNLKLLNPWDCIRAALDAFSTGGAPLQSVEGFIRQIIGWREYIRGVYWQEGSGYRDRNYLQQHGQLPAFYWTGDTDMRCLRECIDPVLEHAWMHHIPRLMVTGNFALIAGVHPRAVGDWYFGMFADSVDWVTTPNTIGMAMYADGTDTSDPVVATKPYAASANYINKMSNYCKHCPYDNKARTGQTQRGPACPFNTFYWDFLIRNEHRFRNNPRMKMILKHIDTMSHQDRIEIRISANAIREKIGVGYIDS